MSRPYPAALDSRRDASPMWSHSHARGIGAIRASALRDASAMRLAVMLYWPSMGVDVNRVIAQLADAGLDLVHAFDAHAITRAISESPSRDSGDWRESRDSLAGW